MSPPRRRRLARHALLALATASLLAGAPAAAPPCPPGTERHEDPREGWCAGPDGLRQGPVWGRYADGSLRFLGAAQDDLLHGPWRSWHATGAPSIEAHYAHGRLSGPFRTWNGEGRLVYVGQHDAAGEMDGRFERLWPDGRPRMRWEMRAGAHHGPVEGWYASGARRVRGERRDGLEHGAWTWWNEDGSVARTCRYAQGRPVDGACTAPDAPPGAPAD